MAEIHANTYDNGEIKVLWQPKICKHSAICFRGLPAVFDPRKRPWINIAGATTEEILAQVRQCPSGAISIVEKEAEIVVPPAEETVEEENTEAKQE
jgi:uncharacterized Fe-S cluster protein YjdI